MSNDIKTIRNMHYHFNSYYMNKIISERNVNIENLNKDLVCKFNNQMDDFFDISNNYVNDLKEKKSDIKVLYFEVKYPGILVGLGYPHEVSCGEITGQISCGMSLDYVTGMPYIPGSSIKGIIRHIFDCAIDSKSVNQGCTNNLYQEFLNIICPYNKDVDAKEIIDKYLGEESPVNQKDIFYGGYIIGYKKGLNNYKLIGKENIAPKNEEKSNIINMLKIRPGTIVAVVIKCNDDRMTIYRKILQYVGIGAKTNVGFGLISECKKEDILTKQIHMCEFPGCQNETKKNKEGKWYQYCYQHRDSNRRGQNATKNKSQHK